MKRVPIKEPFFFEVAVLTDQIDKMLSLKNFIRSQNSYNHSFNQFKRNFTRTFGKSFSKGDPPAFLQQ